MACKDKTTGTWVAQWYEVDMYGKKKRRKKRGFKTMREAKLYENERTLKEQGGYSCAAEPPVQYRLSHLSRRSEPLIKHTICMMRVYSRNALSNPYTSRMEISCSASMLVMLMR